MKNAIEVNLTFRTTCPVCGHAMDLLERSLANNDSNFQCRHCWTQIGHNGPGVQKSLGGMKSPLAKRP